MMSSSIMNNTTWHFKSWKYVLQFIRFFDIVLCVLLQAWLSIIGLEWEFWGTRGKIRFNEEIHIIFRSKHSAKTALFYRIIVFHTERKKVKYINFSCPTTAFVLVDLFFVHMKSRKNTSSKYYIVDAKLPYVRLLSVKMINYVILLYYVYINFHREVLFIFCRV